MDALPEPEETPEEKVEMRDLAAKCEDLGTKIDQATNRKNNSKNVSELVYKLAMALGLRQREAMVFFCASMVYDAGFLALDQDLLSAETLSDDEREQLKHHTDLSDSYLQFVPKRYWQIFEDAAGKHHENMDGSGYPEGLKGESIPQIARLIRVADSYISLSSRRSYREINDKETAIAKLKAEPGIYDPDVVAALESII
jgi:HD-GYP domain